LVTIVPSPDQRRLLERHLDELDLWNRRMRLTTVPRGQAWERHVAESLALLETAQPPLGARCADIGSGGGIPGLVVAVLRPDLSMTLVESDRRKAGFLVHMCGLLELGNVAVAPRRAEEMGRDPAHREHYQAVFSRAAAPPAQLSEVALPLLEVGGTLWALVSQADAAAAVAAMAGSSEVQATAPAPGILAVRKLVATPADRPSRRPRRGR
jgi:16S rRNA (guanine527-N7)-methyltransferase